MVGVKVIKAVVDRRVGEVVVCGERNGDGALRVLLVIVLNALPLHTELKTSDEPAEEQKVEGQDDIEDQESREGGHQHDVQHALVFDPLEEL